MQTLYDLISPAIHKCESIAIPAIEVWTTIITDDVDLEGQSLKLINSVAPNLMVLLLQNLVR